MNKYDQWYKTFDKNKSVFTKQLSVNTFRIVVQPKPVTIETRL